MGGRNWPECGQSCRGCTFLALSGLRMTHSRAKPPKAFPSSDLEICPTQQVTKTQLQASSHKTAFIMFCSSLFPSRFLPPVVLGLGHPGAQRTKVSLPGYRLHSWSHTLACGLCEESSFFSPPLPIHTQNELSSRHRKDKDLCSN